MTAPVVILCGGQGTRMREETEYRPKPMVDVGGRPLLWHIMKLFGHHGHRDFVLCLGYRGWMIKEYFLNYRMMSADLTVDLAAGSVAYQSMLPEDWSVTLAETGEHSMTGARVRRVAPYLSDADLFLCTYGDGVADIDVTALLAFHRAHGRLATVTGVHAPARFGQLVNSGDVVDRFAEKPTDTAYVSGGFFVFDRAVLDRLSPDPACVLEREPLEALARDGQLAMYQHEGFWQCADTIRDVDELRAIWAAGSAPWRVWDAATPGLRAA